MCAVKFIQAIRCRGCFVEVYIIGIYNSCDDTMFYKCVTINVNRSDIPAPHVHLKAGAIFNFILYTCFKTTVGYIRELVTI
jgi:hypothetical protein